MTGGAQGTFRIVFWGVRGSIPTPGSATVRFGGNTSCVEVRCGEELLIFDGGTGLRALGNVLMGTGPIRASMFFSHVHWDHIQGFPFFGPAFVPGNSFELYGGRNVTHTLAETLQGQMNYPNFPVTLGQMAATMRFHDLQEGEEVRIGQDRQIRVRASRLNHPDGVFGYRLEYGGKSLVYATDTEHYEQMDPKVLELARGVDVFIYDAAYTPEEYSGQVGFGSKVGWGHSTMMEGARLASAAGVKKLILFHHDHMQDDDAVAAKEARARAVFPNATAAFEGLTIDLL
ncbi:MAG: MBL fold metallo-hydrolase [Deltaproteobacteria bacterium]|nr:MBL fold metallo-hydrolase [Deltaproteobacteria bacterium]